MKVGFNTLPLKTGHQLRGIGSYTLNLLNSLKKMPEIEIEEFTEISKLGKVDLVHYPFFDLYHNTLPVFKKFPTIVTVHDLIPLVFPEHYPAGIKGTFRNQVQRLALRNIKAVITDSNSSKRDIVKYLNINEKKIFTVYLAASNEFRVIKDKKFLDSVKKKFNLPDNFVLYTGNINWNKNLINLAQACKNLNITLVLVGKAFLNRENLDHLELRLYKEFLEKFESDPIIKTLGFVKTEELIGLMNLAKVGVLPSFYEGFGLPILEMQACGLPVITSGLSSMPEVAGKGALLINPYSSPEISTAIEKIINTKQLRDKLTKLGLENSSSFTWMKTTQQTVAVYKKVLNNE